MPSYLRRCSNLPLICGFVTQPIPLPRVASGSLAGRRRDECVADWLPQDLIVGESFDRDVRRSADRSSTIDPAPTEAAEAAIAHGFADAGATVVVMGIGRDAGQEGRTWMGWWTKQAWIPSPRAIPLRSGGVAPARPLAREPAKIETKHQTQSSAKMSGKSGHDSSRRYDQHPNATGGWVPRVSRNVKVKERIELDEFVRRNKALLERQGKLR
jgi:hypothetical protein